MKVGFTVRIAMLLASVASAAVRKLALRGESVKNEGVVEDIFAKALDSADAISKLDGPMKFAFDTLDGVAEFLLPMESSGSAHRRKAAATNFGPSVVSGSDVHNLAHVALAQGSSDQEAWRSHSSSVTSGNSIAASKVQNASSVSAQKPEGGAITNKPTSRRNAQGSKKASGKPSRLGEGAAKFSAAQMKRDSPAMVSAIRIIIQEYGGSILHEADVAGLAPFYSGERGRKTYVELLQELRVVPWVRDLSIPPL